MLDLKFFKKLKEDYASYNVGRKIIIGKSNDVLKYSKQAIFALHRGELESADAVLKEAEKLIEYLLGEVIKKDKQLEHEGAFKAGLEEYAEARLFYNYLKNHEIGEIKEAKLTVDAYLGGLSDLSGEIVRYAVKMATKRNYEEVEVCRNAVEQLIAEMIQMDIVGNFRTKYDQAKNNLRKLEEILYDIEIRKK